ncbi:MAG: ferredoxin reductase [Xanthomonadales bacterium]|nr:ferredoxin reductase [Xanthomonadales bacterium]
MKPAAPAFTTASRVAARWRHAEFIDFWGRHVSRSYSWDRILARVEAVQPASASASTLVLKANRNWRAGLPGQHVDLTVEIDGVRHTRCYSLSALPNGRRLQLTVAAVPGGLVSSQLRSQLRPGDVVELSAAYGELTLPATLTRPWLLLAGGSGITPLMALLDAMAERGMPVPVTLGYWAARREDCCFDARLDALAARFPRFRVLRIATRGAEAGGRLSADWLAREAPAPLTACTVQAAGPVGFLIGARALCASAAEFRAEPLPPVLGTSSESVQVTLARSGQQIEVPRGQPLLPALEAAGLKPAYGCRRGICNTCVCTRLAGASHDLRDGSGGAGPAAVRLCVHAADSNLTLEM